MDSSYLPKTEIELEKWMQENCFNFNSYSINGNTIYEGFGIERFGGLFIWYYTERGQMDKLKYFQSESEIIEYVFTIIKDDKWAKAHCIGSTNIIEEKKELESTLISMNIEYFQDEIPNYILGPVYRIFVLGCDINKTKHLKDKYYKHN